MTWQATWAHPHASRWLLAAAVVCGVSPRAHAHDAPQARAIVFRPGGRVLLVTNRGLIFGERAQGPWRLMCNEALEISTSELPSIGYASQERLLAATSGGLRWSADDGCDWRDEDAFDGLLVPALVVDTSDPETIYLTTFPVGEASPEVSGDSAIRVSRDGGGSYHDLHVTADNDYIHSLAIAPSAPERIYAAGGVYDMGRAFYVMRSSDAGASWERFDVEVADDEADLVLLAVSPADPDVLLARAVAGEPSVMPERLLVSRDAGESFASVARVMAVRDAAFSADGETVWLAGREGVFVSRRALSSFERVGTATDMTCVVAHEGALLGCGRFAGSDAEPGANGVGISYDGGERFAPWMRFDEVLGPIACDEDAATTPACVAAWHDWQSELTASFGTPRSNPAPAARDSGADTADAGHTADTEMAVEPAGGADDVGTGSGGCSVTRSRGSGASRPWLWACLWALARWRPRRSRGVGAWLFLLLGCAGAETEAPDGASGAGFADHAGSQPAAGARAGADGTPAPVGRDGGGASAGGAGAVPGDGRTHDAGSAAPDDAASPPALASPTDGAADADRSLADPDYPTLAIEHIGAPRRLATGFSLAESPLWDPCGQRLLFTDVRGGGGGGVIHTASADGAIEVFATDTGNANGIAFDVDGSLILAQMGGSPGHVARLSSNGTQVLEPPGSPTLHTPDDVIVGSDGTIYFSDGDFYPIGSLLGYARQLPVYVLTPGADALVEAGRVSGPNGIELSPDERTLYVSAYGAGEIVPFGVADDGTLTQGTALIRGLANSDSLCLDAAGNLYVGVRDGLHVARADGEEVGLIPIPGGTATSGTTSCTFGGEDGSTLFITSWTSLYRVDDMPIPGQDYLVNRARLQCP